MNEREEMERFQKAVDRRLSGLKGDPWLYQKIIAGDRKEKKMKKRISLGLVLSLALMLSFTVALAENWGGISDFLGMNGLVAHLDLKKEHIVTPTAQSCDSKLLDVQVTDAYWSTEGLAVTMRVSARDENQLVVNENEIMLPVELEGEDDVPLDQMQLEIENEMLAVGAWRKDRQVLSYRVERPDMAGDAWEYWQRGGQGEAYILNQTVTDEQRLLDGASYTWLLTVRNLITGGGEEAKLQFTLPPMEKQEGRKPISVPQETEGTPLPHETLDEEAVETQQTLSPLAFATPMPVADARFGKSAQYSWLYQKARELGLQLSVMARSEEYTAYFNVQNLSSRVREADFSQPVSMQVYTLNTLDHTLPQDQEVRTQLIDQEMRSSASGIAPRIASRTAFRRGRTASSCR